MENQNNTQISGVINACTFKRSGVSAEGKNWTIYEVVINGEKFSTFDGMFQNMIGQQGTWNYTVKQTQGRNGQIYYNKTLVVNEIKKQSPPPQQNSPIAGGNTPLINDKEKTSKQIARMNALTNSIKFLEGKPADELAVMTVAETFYRWITDENYIKGTTQTTQNERMEETIDEALNEPPF